MVINFQIVVCKYLDIHIYIVTLEKFKLNRKNTKVNFDSNKKLLSKSWYLYAYTFGVSPPQKIKNAYDTQYSQPVTHVSTN